MSKLNEHAYEDYNPEADEICPYCCGTGIQKGFTDYLCTWCDGNGFRDWVSHILNHDIFDRLGLIIKKSG